MKILPAPAMLLLAKAVSGCVSEDEIAKERLTDSTHKSALAGIFDEHRDIWREGFTMSGLLSA